MKQNRHRRQRRQSGKKKKGIEAVFQHINRMCVQIKTKDRINNNKILYSVLNEFLDKMSSCNKLFSNLKPRLEYLGSYFDGLRVGRPTEYDINIILTLPINYKKIKLDSAGIRGGYTMIKMPSEFRRLFKLKKEENKGYEDTELWCNKNHLLSVSRFRSWMQKVVDATLNTLTIINGVRVLIINNVTYRIEAKISGPANTLIITESNKNVIDVDLVPTLVFHLPKIPSETTINFDKVQSTKIRQYFVVPKPINDDVSWRLAFPFQERHFLYNKQNMKSVIKLLKLLRDVQGFDKLASYYIKTIFLWEATKTTAEFWTTNSLSCLVLHMLKILKESLLERNIVNFWCSEHNLLEKIKEQTCINWANRISHIINIIEKSDEDPKNIFSFFIK